MLHHSYPSKLEAHLTASPPLAFFIASRLGQVIDPSKLPGVTARITKQSYDWVLVSVDNPRPNEVVGSVSGRDHYRVANNESTHKIMIASRPSFQDNISDPVLLLSGTQGTLRGELSSLPARIWVSHSEGFVSAYMLELEDRTVCDGDSGAWVGHTAAPELYGHIVATNAFGDAFVIPAPDTFNNIIECIVSVQLPEQSDFKTIHLPDIPHLPPARILRDLPAKVDQPRALFRKQWNPIFSKNRNFSEDQPWAQAINSLNDSGLNDSGHSLFFEGYNAGGCSSFRSMEIEEFMNSQINATNGDLTYRNHMDAHELCHNSSEERFSSPDLPNADRRLITT
ncbi:hypothetical protein K505DRAFT_383881 [Melanomma pulvis-pyrius CBS 109.77]|uniref:Uncharacterized protein n=1 Tax=Melanomma pulvis-pyrius CBS 109.77 TaxID=1314802 RepID=A0A6A6XEH0_9PLEO|nr:hypothetical protein K505DRAFT_383881 [Melanomma pulvis-pyrius CBS 109.77]